MRPRKFAVAVAAVVEAVVVVTIAGPCGAEQLHDAAAGGGYKAVQLRDPEDEAESLEAEVKVCRVSVVAGGSDVVERMMESRRRLQNGVRPRARRLLSLWSESEVDAGVVRPSDLRSLLGGDVEWMTYGQDGTRQSIAAGEIH